MWNFEIKANVSELGFLGQILIKIMHSIVFSKLSFYLIPLTGFS